MTSATIQQSLSPDRPCRDSAYPGASASGPFHSIRRASPRGDADNQPPGGRVHPPHPSLPRVARRLALIVLGLWAGPVGAQEMCFPRDLAVAGLAAQSAVVVAIGETDNGLEALALEVYVGPAGELTVLVTSAEGFSCIVVRGTGLKIVRGQPS